MMKESRTRVIYNVQSAFYDQTFGRLVHKRIAAAVKHLHAKEGQCVLDLGIGTGASLDFMPRNIHVVGIDLSEGMLKKAREKQDRAGRTGFSLVQADALELPFAEDSFDHVFISHVISVVSDPARVILEAQRVCKRHGRIVILNHFQSDSPFWGTIEKWLSPLCVHLGWRSDLALKHLTQGTNMPVDYRFKLTHPDLWETVVSTNNKSGLIPPPSSTRVSVA